MIIVNLKGGLGNYLFQVAVGYSLSLDNNINYTIDTSRIMQVHSNWSMYLNNIFRNIPVNTNLPIHSIYSYESLTYKPIKYSENMLLDGYYQSDKYWVGNEDKIRDLFSIDDETLKYLNDKYLDIIQSEETCSIHVRRGDFLGIDFYNKLGIDYYTKAINEVGIDKHFIIFSNDIEWCKKNFTNIKVTFIENEKDYIDLYLMSLCKNNITANSTFSWWGSYLNNNPNKKIITPRRWFIHSHSNNDITPNNWIKID